MSFDTIPWSAQLIFTVIALLIVWCLIAWLIKWTDPRARDLRAVARKNRRQRKLLRWLRIARTEIDSAWRNGQFSIGRDVKDRHL